MNATTGEFIALSDQDDVRRPGRLAAALARFDADPGLLLVHGDVTLVDELGTPFGSLLDSSTRPAPSCARDRAG